MKRVFITGGASGIGRASVKKFLKEGWSVGFTDIDETLAGDLCAELKDGERLVFVKGDTRNRDEVRNAVEATVRNSAGWIASSPMRESTVAIRCST